MVARLLDAETTLFAEMDPAGRAIDILPSGTVFKFDTVELSHGMEWVPARLDNGMTGYIRGDARIFTIKPVELLDDQVEVRALPSDAAPVVRRIGKGHKFALMEVVQSEEKDWVRIHDQVGDGVVPGHVRIRDLSPRASNPAPRPDATTDMLFGAVSCIIGVGVTAVTYSSASGGGVYVVAWGAMLFGVLRFIRGAVNLTRR